MQLHRPEERFPPDIVPRPRSRTGRVAAGPALASVLLVAMLLAGCSHLELDLFPLWRSGPVDNQGGWAWEALGPLIYSGTAGATGEGALRQEWGVRPLWSSSHDPLAGRRQIEVAWPVARFRRTRLGDRYEWSDRILPVYWFWGAEGTRNDRSSLFLFPVYIRRTGPPAEGWALFPFYGRIRKFLGIDEVSFVLFPLYASTRRPRGRLHHVLWPFLAWGTGPRYRSLHVFPLYQHAADEGHFETTGYLWPFVSYGTDRISTGRPRRFVHVWPVYGQWTRDQASGWTVLFPLFRGFTDHERDQGELSLPWPFYQRWWHRDQQGWRLWPFYGTFTSAPSRAARSYLNSQFVLWPLFWNRTYGYLDDQHHEIRVVPFFVYDRSAGPSGEGSRLMIWPLVQSDTRPDGSGTLTVGTLMPIRVWNDAAEARWSILLSPYRQQRDAAGRLTAHSLLGLYRRWEAPGFSRWTIPLLYAHRRSDQGVLDQYLMGAVRYERYADGRAALRVLGLPIPLTGSTGETHPASEGGSSE